MKKLIYYLCLVTGIVMPAMSCNDDDNPPARELLLTSIASDGVPVVKLTYDSDMRLRKTDIYSHGELSNYVLYEYGDQGIEQLLRYNADHDLIVRSVLTLDGDGRVIKSEDYTAFTDFESVSATTTFAYDPAGHLKTKSYGTIYDPELNIVEFIYNENNQLIKRDVVTYPNQPEQYTSSLTDFIPRKEMHSHWTNYAFLLSLSKVDVYVEEMFNNNTHEKSWNKDGEIKSEYSTDATDTQFDSDGYLVRQFLTRKSLYETEADVVREMTYEYAE